jgi:hypothetical protein
MFGALAACPIRCTSVKPLNGWSASQQSSVCNSVVSSWRSLPLAVMTVEVGASSVSLVSYNGRNGNGPAFAPTLTYTSATQPCLATWENSYLDDFDVLTPWSLRHGLAKIQWSGSAKHATLRLVPGTTNKADVLTEAGVTTPYRITIVVYGNYGNDRQIGDYGGDTEKSDNITESYEPYAAQWYRELHAVRGSSYTTNPYTLVDAENIAIARLMSAVFSRTPEKFSANSTPAHADERLDYWINVLGIPSSSKDPKWLLRQRAAAHYKAAKGPTLATVTEAVSNLLGNKLVAIHTFIGDDLDTPPTPTFWPAGANDGGAYSIGGHTWLSRRSHIRIEVIETPDITRSEFLQLMNVQLFKLLDTMLPAWVTWNWSVGSDGFRIGVDQIGIDGI